MSKAEEIADELADLALDIEERTGDEYAHRKVADALGTASPTMEEIFLTAIRVRRAQRRALKVIDALNGKGEIPQLPMKAISEDEGH